ncbi:MAG: SH3 domain-containing protein [Minwuia sp.]|uniref:SH3 domain-containing protein n=1 Tax=Minwuia sp. TaxID=2493630 RepID=UPI003A852D5A
MRRFVTLALAALLLAAGSPLHAVEGPETGLPMPRFVSLKSSTANLRSGPGRDYPIRWVYQRRLLPVEIHDEHGHWRAVRDPWGETGWLHKSLLSGRRTAMVQRDLEPLLREPRPGSDVLLYAERRVIGTLEVCENGWCRLSIDGRAGWMPAEALFGADRPAAKGGETKP